MTDPLAPKAKCPMCNDKDGMGAEPKPKPKV